MFQTFPVVHVFFLFQLFTKDGRFKTRYGAVGAKHKQFRKPSGVCFDTNNRLYVADVMNKRIHVLDAQFKWLAYIVVPKACGKFHPMPDMLAVTPAGDLLLANSDGFIKILKLTY